jgi:hypothetical protein
LPKQQFTTKQIKRSRAKLTKQGCNLQKAAIKHKQKLWETLQNPLESTDFKIREHVTYRMCVPSMGVQIAIEDSYLI